MFLQTPTVEGAMWMQQLNEQGEERNKYQGKHCWCAEKLITSGGAVIQNGKTLS